MNDWQITAAWDWVTLGHGALLHHVAHLDDPDAVQDEWSGTGRTSCGRRGWLFIAGIFSRLSARRCARCCRATGMPLGDGSPKNDEACRPIVQAELDGAEGVHA